MQCSILVRIFLSNQIMIKIWWFKGFHSFLYFQFSAGVTPGDIKIIETDASGAVRESAGLTFGENEIIPGKEICSNLVFCVNLGLFSLVFKAKWVQLNSKTLQVSKISLISGEFQEDLDDERGGWDNKLDFLFSCISVSVGLGSKFFKFLNQITLSFLIDRYWV